MYEYADILLKDKKSNKLLISMSRNDKYFKDYIYYKALELGYEEVSIFYSDYEKDTTKIKKIMEENGDILILLTDKINEIDNMIIKNYPNTILGALPNNKKFHLLKHKEILKKLQYKELIIKDICEIDLKLRDVKTKDKISEIPQYGINLEGNLNGFIRCIKPAILNENTIEELALEIKNNKITDFDCSTNADLLKEVIYNNKFNTFYLTDKDNPFYNIYTLYNNVLLDKYAAPFISFDTELGTLIVPVTSKNLKVSTGGKLIYDKEKILIK
jgi:leucyl aminopeptidase (aminopeptidase T)